ncbi:MULTISPECIES: S1 RNA-binding domain-containing protein [unclassified Granulicatella]|uniref:CvfB family protein n=1 Tax=unclassified Granulicatella TaxID=2630493 RepID=UPI0010746713|nr:MULTISPECIES: S1-like domain-containing RNA-binding protein [unclassified Granulicatella]MBF0780558.1 DNA-binding protein [Granulicatella sp. 19428wC4_WM01]TFU94910.1 DNA-binding protein [Granulicatella sp. WM01]
MDNSVYGTTITAMIIDENQEQYFVQKNGVTYALDKNKNENNQLKIGDMVQGFVYESSTKKRRMTTCIPKVQQGKYGWGTVTQVRKDLGVFVDIGLPDKEIVVSLDDLPQITSLWPKKEDKLLLSLKVDKKERIWGELASEKIFRTIAKKGKESSHNQDVEGIAFRLKLVGTYILTSDYHIGFIHPSERVDEPRLGERVKGRVIGVRPDGVLNISLRQRAHEAIDDDSQMIMALLEQSTTYSLPYSDKSQPDEIKQYFGISKGQFKRAIGRLLKEKKIEQKKGSIYLIQHDVK